MTPVKLSSIYRLRLYRLSLKVKLCYPVCMKDLLKTTTSHTPVPVSECALARAIKAIGDAWSLLILREVICGVGRFDQMREDLGITRSVLSDRLAKLVDEGVLEHYAYRDPGQRARKAYALTEKGQALLPVLIALREWGGEHIGSGTSRLRLQLQTLDGQRVETQLRREDGSKVDNLADVVATVKSD